MQVLLYFFRVTLFRLFLQGLGSRYAGPPLLKRQSVCEPLSTGIGEGLVRPQLRLVTVIFVLLIGISGYFL